MTMPWHLSEGASYASVAFGLGEASRLQWQWAARMPNLVAQAARKGGYESNAHYIRSAVIAALVRDLDLDPEELDAEQPGKPEGFRGYGQWPSRVDVV